jgi:hypothetical protein
VAQTLTYTIKSDPPILSEKATERWVQIRFDIHSRADGEEALRILQLEIARLWPEPSIGPRDISPRDARNIKIFRTE